MAGVKRAAEAAVPGEAERDAKTARADDGDASIESGLGLVLGSSSKWRRSLFGQCFPGRKFSFLAPDIDEKAIRHEDPEKLTIAIAHAKADKLQGHPDAANSVLVCSDQVVTCNGEIREKPVDEVQARQFMSSYAEHPCVTVSGVVVVNTRTGQRAEGVDTASLALDKPVPDDVIDKLIAKGDCMSTAGAFTGEDPLMEPYLGKLTGTMESIQGLPFELTRRLVTQVSSSAE